MPSIKFLLPAVLMFLSCNTVPKRESFHYLQNFSPDNSQIVSQKERLVFGDVREECQLSSWTESNWQLTPGGIKAIGSRLAEWERREKSVLEKYQGNESFVTLRGYRVPWLTLSMGDLDWMDYAIESTVIPGDNASAGIAFRYQNSRQYYAFMLEKENRVGLYFRPQDQESTPENEAWISLKSVPFQVQPDKSYEIKINVQGNQIACAVNNDTLIEHKDTSLKYGKIALLADNPAAFGPVSVTGELERKKLAPLPWCAKPEIVHEIALPIVEGERDFFFFDVDSDKELEIIIAELQENNNAYRCLEFDGTQLWHLTGIKNPLTEGGDKPIQVFDINGDGKNELVLAVDFEIQVRDGSTANLLYSASTPEPNPYYDSRDYRYERLLGDALCPVKLSPDVPPGLYIKDRYTNIWVYDHNLNFKWHKALSTGHFPLPVDIDKDGAEELLVCHTLLAPDGTEIWSLPLSDHVDNMAFESLQPDSMPKRFYLAAGEMGLVEVEPGTGNILTRHQLGHIQTITIADFLPEKAGLEILTQTLWREDQIHYLLDKDLNLLSTWQGPFGRIYPLPWGEKGRQLALTPDGIVDPPTGRIIVPAFGDVLTVLDDDRWGNGLVLVYEGEVLKIFGPGGKNRVPYRNRPYRTVHSNYLPEVELYR